MLNYYTLIFGLIASLNYIMPLRLIAPTFSYVKAKRLEFFLTLVFMANMLALAAVGHATVLRPYELALLLLFSGVISCALFWKPLARYESKTRVLFSFFIPGFIIFGALLWFNYLTADTRTETYLITGYDKESEKPGDHNTGVYIINLENGHFADYKEYRMFEPYLFNKEAKSITYQVGKGWMRIQVVKGYSFDSK